MAYKLLVGGSPCNFWSCGHTQGERETEPDGFGWELFRNYLIAKEKFKPDGFFYENVSSAEERVKGAVRQALGADELHMLIEGTPPLRSSRNSTVRLCRPKRDGVSTSTASASYQSPGNAGRSCPTSWTAGGRA